MQPFRFRRSHKMIIYFLLGWIAVAVASLSTLGGLMDQKNPKYYETLQLLFYLNLTLGLAGIFYGALYTHFSDKETKGMMKELEERLEKRLDDAGIARQKPSSAAS